MAGRMRGKLERTWADTYKHEGDVTCVAYNNGFVFSGGCDGKIKIWDQDLRIKKTLIHHETFIYALTVTPSGKLYSSSCDGTIKFSESPLESDDSIELVSSENSVECLVYSDNRLFSGDSVGIVAQYENDKLVTKYNLVEQIRSLAVEKNKIYATRESDGAVTITEINPEKPGSYATNAALTGGRAPIALLGPVVDGLHSYVAFATSDGKGLTLALTGENNPVVWTIEDCHSMKIISIVGNENVLYSAGYDGEVKRWVDIDTQSPKLNGKVNIGTCINSICLGAEGEIVYTGSSDGVVRKATFYFD